MLEVDRQSGGFTPHAPLNRVPSGCSTRVESLELFHWGSTVLKKRFQKAPLTQYWWSFFMSIL